LIDIIFKVRERKCALNRVTNAGLLVAFW